MTSIIIILSSVNHRHSSSLSILTINFTLLVSKKPDWLGWVTSEYLAGKLGELQVQGPKGYSPSWRNDRQSRPVKGWCSPGVSGVGLMIGATGLIPKVGAYPEYPTVVVVWDYEALPTMLNWWIPLPNWWIYHYQIGELLFDIFTTITKLVNISNSSLPKGQMFASLGLSFWWEQNT